MKKRTHNKTSVTLRKRKLKRGKISLYLDIYQHGNRKYEFLGFTYNLKDKYDEFTKMELANKIRVERENSLINSKYGYVPDNIRKSNFLDYYKKFLETYIGSTKQNYLVVLNILEKFCNGFVSFNELDKYFLENFIAYLKGKNCSHNTIVEYLNKIKACLKQAYKDKIIISEFYKDISYTMLPVKKEYLTINELKTLKNTDCENEDVKQAFLFGCYTGLRLSDIKNLKWENISFPESKITITQQKTREVVYIPLNDLAIEILENIQNKNKNNKIYSLDNRNIFNLPAKSTIERHLSIWSKKAGIKKHITFHSSRHTFATISLTLGTDIYTVSKLLGHKDIKTTQVYGKIVDDKLRNAVNRFDDIFSKTS